MAGRFTGSVSGGNEQDMAAVAQDAVQRGELTAVPERRNADVRQ
jgi:hypothetical protein